MDTKIFEENFDEWEMLNNQDEADETRPNPAVRAAVTENNEAKVAEIEAMMTEAFEGNGVVHNYPHYFGMDIEEKPMVNAEEAMMNRFAANNVVEENRDWIYGGKFVEAKAKEAKATVDAEAAMTEAFEENNRTVVEYGWIYTGKFVDAKPNHPKAKVDAAAAMTEAFAENGRNLEVNNWIYGGKFVDAKPYQPKEKVDAAAVMTEKFEENGRNLEENNWIYTGKFVKKDNDLSIWEEAINELPEDYTQIIHFDLY